MKCKLNIIIILIIGIAILGCSSIQSKINEANNNLSKSKKILLKSEQIFLKANQTLQQNTKNISSQNAPSAFSEPCINVEGVNTNACVKMGIWYFKNGRWDPKETYFISTMFFDKACEYGNLHGCYRMGMAYQMGYIGRDDKKAIMFYQKACNLGHNHGCKMVKLLSKWIKPIIKNKEDR